MLNLRQRLTRLEKNPLLRPVPKPEDSRMRLALKQINNEDLALLIVVTRDLTAGVYRTLTQGESAVVEAYEAGVAKVYATT
jgi:hypothetical protein